MGHLHMFIAALFTKAKSWKQTKCPPTGELINKMWSTESEPWGHYAKWNTPVTKIEKNNEGFLKLLRIHPGGYYLVFGGWLLSILFLSTCIPPSPPLSLFSPIFHAPSLLPVATLTFPLGKLPCVTHMPTVQVELSFPFQQVLWDKFVHLWLISFFCSHSWRVKAGLPRLAPGLHLHKSKAWHPRNGSPSIIFIPTTPAHTPGWPVPPGLYTWLPLTIFFILAEMWLPPGSLHWALPGPASPGSGQLSVPSVWSSSTGLPWPWPVHASVPICK